MATATKQAGEAIWEHTHQPPMVKLINATGRGLRRFGVRWPRIDAGKMMATARRRAGLSDFGDDRFREGLDVAIAAFEGRDNAHAFGRIFFREYMTAHLVNRLKVQADLTNHPEILDVPVARPIFITGLPRSGTTFLHRLMSEDPEGRTMRTWEGMMPSPSPTREAYATDPRIAIARRQAALVNRLSPRLAMAHEFAAEAPEEDNDLHARDFAAAIIGFLFDVPEYNTWLRDRDVTETYRYARKQLQLLSWKYRADHWVLKAPSHNFALPALLGAHPDASIIVTHRDPTQVLPSLCSLAAGFRGMLCDRVDLHALGLSFVETLSKGTNRAIAARADLDPARFFDVSYEKMVADPISTVREACRYFGYDFGPEYESNARRYLAANPRHKHGAHRYHLGDFGLDAETVNEHFAGYRAWLEGRGLVGDTRFS